MWKKRMLLYVLVMAVLLVPKQLHAQSLSEEFRDAATLSIGKTIVESQTYYKYTAQEAQTLQISFGNIIECSPNVTIYDSEGREIFYFNETYFYFAMQKGQTCYVRAGGAYEEEESYQLNVKVDSHDAGIKNVEILDAPSLVGYRELDDELMDWIGENVYSCFFRDLKIRVEWEDGTVSTEQFAVQEYNPTWLIADGLVYENTIYV